MDNARKIVIEVLNDVFFNKAYSNIALNKTLKNSHLNANDRALATEILYGTIKYKYTIDIILKHFIKIDFKKVDKYILNVLRISVYQIKYLDKIPDFAVVNEAVELAKKYVSLKSSKFVNGVLRNYLRNKEDNFCTAKDKVLKLSFKHSFEPWMVRFFMKQYGNEEIESILEGLNNVPSVTVRVNSLKASYDDVWNKLEELSYEIEEGSVCPEAIKIKRGSSIENNPLFLEGYFTVQDESAMITAACLDIEEGMTVMDLCSAPGGKATHAGELLNNTGRVLAFDIYENKLNLISQNAKRLGINNITCSVMDASKYNEKYSNVADRIIVDAPCSGLGIIKKKPEIKWTKNINDLQSLALIQQNILKNAAKYLKKDGILLYSTCTLNKEENEIIVREFVKGNPNFKVENLYFGKVDNFHYSEYGLTIFPNEHMDGFFMCKLKKQW